MLLRLSAIVTIAALLSSAPAATIVSSGSGEWNTNAGTIWVGGVAPRTGSQVGALDSVEILVGHFISFVSATPGVGGTNSGANPSNDFAIGDGTNDGVANGNVMTINGGTFAHANSTGNWMRIGNWGQGTLDIKDGKVYLPVGNVQVGVHGPAADGLIRIGDGTGAAGSSLLTLHDTMTLVEGLPVVTASGHTTELNLGSQQSNADGTNPAKIGSVGIIIIESDGVLEGANYKAVYDDAKKVWNYNQSTTRIGRYASDEESMILVKAGGKFNVRSTLEIGSYSAVNDITAKGLLHLDGVGATVTQSVGEVFIGYSGEGRMIVENGAEYIRLTNPFDVASNRIVDRHNLYIGRSATGKGTLTIRTGGKFIRDTGGAVGDLYIGVAGRGTVTVDSGGEFMNRSTNWDWIGVEAGSHGAVYVNEGGKYTTAASIVVGRDAANATLAAAEGILQVDGGELVADNLHVGQNGNGLFRLIDGTAKVDILTLSRGIGNSTFDVQGGELIIQDNFFAGGDTDGAWVNNTGPAVATMTQSGGIVRATNAMSIGLSVGHTATYDMTGGEFYHASSDLTVGERGTGRMYVGEDARFYDESTQASAYFFVGRLDGSDGRLIVDGYLEKTNAAAGIWVGHGSDAAGMENNTTGAGLIGGSGTIKSPGGVWVGNQGTITGGTKTTAGMLTLDGGLNLISTAGSTSKSTFFVNFDSSSALGADRVVINGQLNIDGAVIDGVWDVSGMTGLDSRYWVLVNQDESQISGNLFANTSFSSSHYLADDYFGLGADGFVSIGGMEFAMFYSADFGSGALLGGNDLVLSAMGAVPEPSLASLWCVGLAALVMRRRRRR